MIFKNFLPVRYIFIKTRTKTPIDIEREEERGQNIANKIYVVFFFITTGQNIANEKKYIYFSSSNIKTQIKHL